jgi:hypothetical protein
VTAIETRATEFTLASVVALMVPREAVIVLDPRLTPFAKPVLLMPTMDGWEELQLTVPVRSRLLPSLYRPVAVNCWFWPTASNGFAGAMEIDCRTGAETATVRTVEPVAACRAALIFVVPAFKPEASPVEFREATAADEDDQAAS